MKTSIATVSISGTYEEKVAAIAKAGFDGIEIFENDLLTFPGTPRAAGQLAREAGLDITLFQPFRDFEGLPEPHRALAFDRARRKFDLMSELGVDRILICSSVSPHALGGIDRAADDLAELGGIAQKQGIIVGYEALAWGRYINDHRDAWEIVRRADHPNVALILDSFHTLARGIDVDSIRSIPGDKIAIVQLADAPKFTMDTLYWSRHFRNMPGQGELPVADFTRAVLATGYSGPLSLEIFNDQFRGASPEVTARDGHRSLIYLQRQADMDRPSDTGRPAGQPLPQAFSFVEFAADASSGAAFESKLNLLGFRKVGHHITKDVDLWQQGPVNIVVNRDPQEHARRIFEKHGLAVCDLGVRVDDANAVRDWATDLLASPFPQETGPLELTIPAIRGIGDSLMHFTDDSHAHVWEVEFGVSPEVSPHAGIGLTGIDHVAQTMAYDEILTWSLFYRSVFGMRQAPMVDIIDPGGLVRSQAMESANAKVRFTLNGADNQGTLADHFTRHTGASIQHIAFTCADIFETAAALRANGFRQLEIAPNYFDDLQARFGLDDKLTTALRDMNIMYDRDDDGDFFHFYGKPWPNGFFFEFLQRRDGYNGYGAPNAIFRLAAQKRYLSSAENAPVSVAARD